MMFTLCLLNVVIEKNTYIVIKVCLFNVLIPQNYFVFNVIVFNIKYKCDYKKLVCHRILCRNSSF
jgi:hypothetical protein